MTAQLARYLEKRTQRSKRGKEHDNARAMVVMHYHQGTTHTMDF